ncbi:MAG: hypothetical protein V4494_06620 [Chlamydiota bacterium]
MTEEFKIYIDRLKNGHTEKVQEEVDPSFLDITEKELSFPVPVAVQGEAYLAEDHLILHMKVKTRAQIPCAVCNEPFLYPIETDFYNTIPVEEITNPVFDYSDILRESILIEIPPFTECHEGACPERETISKFLKKETSTDAPDVQFPFSGLGL